MAATDPPPGDPERMPASAASSEEKYPKNAVAVINSTFGGLTAGIPVSASGDGGTSGPPISSAGGGSGGTGGGSGGAQAQETAQMLAITSGGSPTQTTGSGYKVSTTIGPRLSTVKATTANGYQVKLGVQGMAAP